ncbi:MAG TPA: hypothetical protein VGO67_26195 [Verrucomicrobiae bacterium]
MKIFFLVLFIACAAIARDNTGGEETLTFGKVKIHVESESGLSLPAPIVENWVRRSAVAVTNYIGFFPAKNLHVEIHRGDGGAVDGGVTHGDSRIDVWLGPRAKERDLLQDWVLTHEMFHLAFPTLNRRYLWMMEGLSDYLEPIARARAGQWADRDAWKEFADGLPQGLPIANEQGLDDSHGRDRIYWGGNLYWLLADVRIRVKTNNRRGLEDAIRAILKEGGNGGADWSIDKVLRVGDKATATTVLKELYEEIGVNRGNIDLNAIWKSLGVVYKNDAIQFDDSAPLAAVRKSITQPK